MKTELKSSAILNTPTGPLLRNNNRPMLEFGAGFRQFLSSFPAEPEPTPAAAPVHQPLRFLEAVPAIDDCPIHGNVESSLASVQESLSRSLGAAIFLAARPTTQSLRLASAVHTVRSV